MCSWTLPCTSSLVPSVLHLSHGFQCSPTLNHQHYERRLPLTSWWRKSSNMTVGQSSLISLAHHCYDWHPGSRCGWACNQLTSKVDGGVTGSRLRRSHLACDPTIWQPGFNLPRQQSLLNRFRMDQGHCGACRRKWRLTDTDLSLWRDPNDVSHCQILSPDKTEWRLISATLCGWRCCFVADQLWFMTCIQEEEER